MLTNELINQLQPFMRKSKIYQALFEADAKQFDSKEAAIDDLNKQLSVDTATWALGIYEHELNIPTELNKPYSERRSVIKSKMRGTGKVDAALIKLVADSYSNGDVDIHFDGRIHIIFTNVIGAPPNMEDLKNAIEEIKPAHLAVIYILLYNQYKMLAQYTHQHLASFTHEQLRSSTLN